MEEGLLDQSLGKRETLKFLVGGVVLLQNDSTERVLWKLALVKELLPGMTAELEQQSCA